MSKDNFFFIGIALIALGVLGILFSGYIPASWGGPGGRTGFGPMDSMMGGGGMMGGQGMMGGGGMMGGQGMMGGKTAFSSNGERIYYTAASNSGKRISASMEGMTMSPPMMSCVNCHGKDGKGGKVQTPMGVFKAANITYKELTEEEEPPYTDKL